MITQKPITVDEFFELVKNNPDKYFKFDAEGEVIEVTPKRLHGRTQVVTAHKLVVYMESDPLPDYEVLTECLHDIKGWLCQPDVSIDLKGEEQVLTTAPLLAVEIKSDGNTYKDQRAKARKYIEVGAAMVWLIFPEKQIIEVYQPDEDDQILTINDTLDGGKVLPGFTLNVKDLF